MIAFGHEMKLKIFAALLAGIIASGFAIYPQLHLASLRGADFNGAFATYDLDEMAYASYLQALIDGRPRKNDPYTGRDDSADNPQPESLFSIQFVTAKLAAWPARALGLSAVDMMPVISIFSAFFTALALFWLANLITRDTWLSLACALVVIAGGALISGIGAIGEFRDGGVAYPYLPFLRRHIPSMSFPFLFAFFGCLWKGIYPVGVKRGVLYGFLAANCFAILLFSYFYLWTSAAAVFAVLAIMAAAGFVNERKRDLWFLASVAGFCMIAAVPYMIILGGRSEMTDKAQLLVFTRAPDLNRNIEIIGAALGLCVIIMTLSKLKEFPRIGSAFIAAFGLSAVAVFNQQVVTGRSLQPFHYEYYSMNYVVLLAVVLFAAMMAKHFFANWPRAKVGVVVAAILAAVAWGAFETRKTTVLWDDINTIRDEAMPVNRRLRELAAASAIDPRTIITLNTESLQADSQPTVAPFPVLWARHQHVFAGVGSQDENRLRYYKLLYYSDLDGAWLRDALNGCNNIEACIALVGWDRFNATLSVAARPITVGEIEAEVRRYQEFVRSFGEVDAYEPQLAFLVRSVSGSENYGRLSRWYELGPEETVGKYVIRKLSPRPQ